VYTLLLLTYFCNYLCNFPCTRSPLLQLSLLSPFLMFAIFSLLSPLYSFDSFFFFKCFCTSNLHIHFHLLFFINYIPFLSLVTSLFASPYLIFPFLVPYLLLLFLLYLPFLVTAVFRLLDTSISDERLFISYTGCSI
jgi:hypothetical protein